MHVKVTDHLREPPSEIDLDIAQVFSVGADLEDWPPFIVTGLDGRYMAQISPEDASEVMHAMVDLQIEKRGKGEGVER